MPSFSISLRSSTSTSSSKLLAELLRLLARQRRRAVVGRPVAELARQRHAGGDGRAAAQALLHAPWPRRAGRTASRARSSRGVRARLGVPVDDSWRRPAATTAASACASLSASRRRRRPPGCLAPPPLSAPSPPRDRGLERLGRRIAGDGDHDPRAPRRRPADAGRASCPFFSRGRRAPRHRPAGCERRAERRLWRSPTTTTTSASASSSASACRGAT